MEQAVFISAEPQKGDAKGLEKIFSTIEYDKLPAESKWNLIGTEVKLNDSFTRKIGDFVRCSRGLATGANNFYIFDKSKIKEWDLNPKYFQLCITKSTHISGLQLTDKLVEQIESNDKPVYVLDLKEKDSKDPRVAAYIEHGLSLGVDKKYLPARRTPWYSMENIKIAPALIGTFFRDSVKVISNGAKVANLTCFHGLFLKGNHPQELLDAVCAFLMSDVAAGLVRQNIRKLGDGLNKFEPRDVQSIPCPNFEDDEILTKNLSEVYRSLLCGEIDNKSFNNRIREILV